MHAWTPRHDARATSVATLALALCIAVPVFAEVPEATPTDPAGASEMAVDAVTVALGEQALPTPVAPPSTAVAPGPPAPLEPLPHTDLRFARIDPLELLVTAATGGAGCAAIALPFGACGALTAVYGVGAIVGVLGLGLPAIVAVTGAFAAYCIAVPTFFALGPVSSSTAFVGAVNGLALFTDEVPVVPMLIAAMPSIGIALFGSTLAFVGTTMLSVAVLGVDPEGIQASTVLIAAGLLTAALSGPVAVVATVTAGQIFASVDDESAVNGASESVPVVPTTEIRAASTGF